VAGLAAALVAVFLGLGAVYAWVVPPGEAPDEPAHLAPQLLFVSATVNNDGAVTCLATWTLAGLVALLRPGARPSTVLAVASVLAAAAALFAKASAFGLTVPIGVTAFLLARRRHRREAWLLGGLWLLAAAGWMALSWMLFRSAWPPSPTGTHAPDLVRLVLEPRWIASLWTSFWARFGWYNLPLPTALYTVFLVPSSLGAVGVVRRLAGPRRPDAALLLVPVSLLLAELALLIAYMTVVDWQPQGRLLFPAVGTVALLAALGAEPLGWAPRTRRAAVVVPPPPGGGDGGLRRPLDRASLPRLTGPRRCGATPR
jgi:uncharacterized membrane protein (UPF0136 family)